MNRYESFASNFEVRHSLSVLYGDSALLEALRVLVKESMEIEPG